MEGLMGKGMREGGRVNGEVGRGGGDEGRWKG